MYSEKHIIEMVDSYNCLRLDNKHVFQVEVYEDPKDKQKFFELGNKKIPFKNLKVGQLAELIARKGKFGDSDILDLWQVDVDESELNPSSTKEDIRNLGGVIMKRQSKFIKYFQDGYVPKEEDNIQIVVVIATTTTAGSSQQGVPQGPVVGSLGEALSVILRNIPVKIETSSERIEILEEMPLKERDTKEALTVFENNVTKSFNRFASKSSFNFLVCGGAAGIGKTRWGKEFFNSVEKHWDPPASWGKPEYLYLLLDFVNGVRLCDLDVDLTASVILGLRIAYDYFAREVMSFEAFQYQARHFFGHFKINLVFSHILSQGIEPDRKVIAVLHIDEYQEIFAFESNWKGGLTGKGLFKEMLYALGPLMIEYKPRYYVQTFLSGTASQDVTNSFKATEYSFKFVKCPLLSNKSIIEIFDYYAEKRGDKEKLWMYNTNFLQLLYDTGGLPRALETVLDECFKRDSFVPKLSDKNFTLFDDIFHAVINVLTNKYKLDKFIRNHRKASCQLLHHCIGTIPVQLNTKLGSEQTVTVEDLERDGFLILKNIGLNNYLIEMPFYFIYIYNMWLNTASATIHKMFQPESKMSWNTWEKFVANYEIFRNNLLLELEQYEEGIISLGEFYCGAIGKVSVLNIRVRLEKLELCEAKNQFPKTGFPRDRTNNKVMDLDGLVIVNGHSAPFGDVILLRKTIPENRNLLIVHQQKWYTTSQTFTIDDAVNECNKNKNAYKYVKDDNLREFLEEAHIVTVIFTSRPFKGDPKDLPDDCLIISKENFNQYFGPLFASRLTFDIINDLNINSAEPKRIANVIKGVGEVVSQAIYENRPYKSATEVIEKVVEKNSTYRSYLESARTQLENCSYTPHSFLDNEHDSMILDEYNSYSGDNDIEMDDLQD